MLLFLKGVFWGTLVATSPGPILTIMVKNGLRHGYKFTLLFGMGVALIDVMFCLAAFLGVTPIIASNQKVVPFLLFFAGIMMIAIGIDDFRNVYKNDGLIPAPKKYSKIDFNHPFTQGFLISLFNPGALFFWIAISAGFSFFSIGESLPFILGVSLGSPLWFFIFAYLISHLKKIVTENFIYYFTIIAGIVLVCAGIYFIYGSFVEFGFIEPLTGQTSILTIQ